MDAFFIFPSLVLFVSLIPLPQDSDRVTLYYNYNPIGGEVLGVEKKKKILANRL